MRLRVGYDIGYAFEQPTPMIATVNVHHSRIGDLERPDTMTTSPVTPHVSYRDGFGNWCNRLVAPAGDFSIRADTVVRDDGRPDPVPWGSTRLDVQSLPAETLVYLLASRYCESDALVTAAWDLFGKLPTDWTLVHEISSFVHSHITFDYLAADPTKTAADVFEQRRGVCRDFAHLGVAFCRAMNIPARYCTGYLGDVGVARSADPMDFSGWFEVYMSGGWHTVDPRNHHPRIGRVLIAQGRDAADVAITTTFGPNTLTHFTVVTDRLDSAA
ncbi:MAG: transglutaminase-like domain-containing protein [Kineosporiaceae bacterium]